MKSPVQAKFRDVLETLRKKVAGVQAVVMLGHDGVVDHILADPLLNVETIAGEYATLLRITARTSEDAGAGKLIEQIIVSDKSIMIARAVSPEHFLVLLSRTQDQIGRARYELKKAAWEIQKRGT